jgi:hypothetical protein
MRTPGDEANEPSLPDDKLKISGGYDGGTIAYIHLHGFAGGACQPINSSRRYDSKQNQVCLQSETS